MIDIITEYEKRGEARGKELGAAEALYGMGLSVDEIAKKMDKTPEEIRELLKKEFDERMSRCESRR